MMPCWDRIPDFRITADALSEDSRFISRGSGNIPPFHLKNTGRVCFEFRRPFLRECGLLFRCQRGLAAFLRNKLIDGGFPFLSLYVKNFEKELKRKDNVHQNSGTGNRTRSKSRYGKAYREVSDRLHKGQGGEEIKMNGYRTDNLDDKENCLVRKHLTFWGWVQGVGFRYRAFHAACRVGATGWVCNNDDGSVTMEIQGTEDQIDQVILMIAHGTYVQIDEMKAKTVPLEDGERGFEIL